MAPGLNLTCEVRCSGTTHRIEWDGVGPVRWTAHDDPEDVLAALTGEEPSCAQVAKSVDRSRRTPRALQLLAGAERVTEAGTSRPDGRLAIVRAPAGAFGLWKPQLHERLSDQAVLHALPTRWLAVLVGEAAVAACASPRAWERQAPDDRAELLRATARLALLAGAPHLATGSVAVDPLASQPTVDGGRVVLSPAWLGRVWARGAASLGGRLAVALQPDDGTATVVVAEAGRAVGLEEVAAQPGVGGTWAAAGYAVG